MKTTLAVLALALTVPAAAQLDFETAHALAASGRTSAKSAQDRDAALRRTFDHLNDGVVATFLNNTGVHVAFADQPEASKIDGNTIFLSTKLPLRPRVLAPLIAKEVSMMMFIDMPPCAERSYMRRAIAAHVWLDLGGDIKLFPVIEPLDGSSVPALSDYIAPWIKEVQSALADISASEGLSIIPNLEGRAQTEEERASLSVANSRFVKFLGDERSIRQSAGLR